MMKGGENEMKRKGFVYLVIFAVILVLPLFRNTNADKTNPENTIVLLSDLED